MRAVRPLVCSLALTLSVGALALPVMADAADAVALGGPLVAFTPASAVIGDGKAEALATVVALRPDGSPLVGMKLKLTATGASVLGVTESAPGQYTVRFVPEAVSAPGKISLGFKSKTPEKQVVSGTLSVDVVPAAPMALSLSVNPVDAVVGQTKEATLSAGGPAGMAAPVFRANEKAAIGEAVNMGDGRFTARYEVAKVNFPHLGIVTAVDAKRPSAGGVATVIRMSGSVAYPVVADAGAAVVLKVGEREFGPVPADANGKVDVPVQVPPGISTATVVSVKGGQTKEEALDLRVPETRRVQLFPVPLAIPEDARLRVPVRAVVLTPAGERSLDAKVVFSAEKGSFGATVHEGQGVYMAEFTPPDGDAALELTLTVKVDGASDVQQDSMGVTLLPTTAGSLSATADGAKVDVGLLSPSGVSLKGRGVWLGNGRESTLVKGASGGAAAGLTSGGSSFVVAAEPVTVNPGEQLVLWPMAGGVSADGEAELAVLVGVLDGFGALVANQTVTLSVETGDGKLPTSVVTDGSGLAVVSYTAGKTPGMVRIHGESGTARGAGALVQAAGAEVLATLPVGGPASEEAARVAFSKRVAVVSTEAGGAAVAAAGAAAGAGAVAAGGLRPLGPADEAAQPAAGGEPVKVASTEQPGVASADAAIFTMDLVPTPNPVAPGGKVSLKVSTYDANGLAVPGQKLDLLTSTGTLSEIVESSPGVYEATLSLPADAKGEVKISAIAPNGVLQLAKITVDKDAAVVAVAEAPAEVKSEKAEKPPKAAGVEVERAWMRVRALGMLGSLRYEQRPGEEPGPLLPNSLSVGGAAGGSPATTGGFELDARAFLPEAQFLGAHVSVRGSSYAIGAPGFSEPVNDYHNNIQAELMARAPFDVGQDRFWVGARAGLHVSDMLLFEGCLQPGCRVTYRSLNLVSLGLGAEIGAEIQHFYFTGAYAHSFARGTVPYAHSVDIAVGYDITEMFSADVGFTSQTRNVNVQGADSGVVFGEVYDAQILFKAGVGLAFR